MRSKGRRSPFRSRKDVSEMKKGIKGIIAGLIILMSIGTPALTGCAAKAETAVTEQVSVECDWDKTNSALEKYGFGKTYYLNPDYKDDEKNAGTVIIYNYDPESRDGFREVPCQITISYGRTEELKANGKVYPVPMITISLVDNKSKKAYSAVYGVDGRLAEETGEWVLAEDKNEKLRELMEEAVKIFGLEEQK